MVFRNSIIFPSADADADDFQQREGDENENDDDEQQFKDDADFNANAGVLWYKTTSSSHAIAILFGTTPAVQCMLSCSDDMHPMNLYYMYFWTTVQFTYGEFALAKFRISGRKSSSPDFPPI